MTKPTRSDPHGIVGMVPGLRASHGNGRATSSVRSEVLPPDEIMQLALQADQQAVSGSERRPNGQFQQGARSVQSKGGKARHRLVTVTAEMGLGAISANADFAPYSRLATKFRRATCRSIADNVGGGVCGIAPSALVENAAILLAAGRYLVDHANGSADILTKAKSLFDGSRLQLLSAQQLAAVEAQARAKSHKADPIAALRADLGLDREEPSK